MNMVIRISDGNKYSHGAKRPCFMIFGTMVPPFVAGPSRGIFKKYAPVGFQILLLDSLIYFIDWV